MFRYLHIVFSLVLSFMSLVAFSDQEQGVQVNTRLEQSIIADVDLLTGRYAEQSIDHIIDGAEPLVLARYTGKSFQPGVFGDCWVFNHDIKGRKNGSIFTMPSGCGDPWAYKYNKHTRKSEFIRPKGLIPYYSGDPWAIAEPLLKVSKQLSQLHPYLGERIFGKVSKKGDSYLLLETHLPNGYWIKYGHNHGKLESIYTQSGENEDVIGLINWAKFEYKDYEGAYDLFIHTSDGQQLSYTIVGGRLTSFSKNGLCLVEYEYLQDKGEPKVSSKKLRGGETLYIEYYSSSERGIASGRVAKILRKEGKEKVPAYTFHYEQRGADLFVEVQEVGGGIKCYLFNDKGYLKNYQIKPHVRAQHWLEYYYKYDSRGYILSEQAVEHQVNKEPVLLFEKQWAYDSEGRLISSKLIGNLTGKVKQSIPYYEPHHRLEAYEKRYYYNKINEKRSEVIEEDGFSKKKSLYSMRMHRTGRMEKNNPRPPLAYSPILAAKFEYEGDRVVKREHFRYAPTMLPNGKMKNLQPIEKLIDDGSSEDPYSYEGVTHQLFERYMYMPEQCWYIDKRTIKKKERKEKRKQEFTHWPKIPGEPEVKIPSSPRDFLKPLDTKNRHVDQIKPYDGLGCLKYVIEGEVDIQDKKWRVRKGCSFVWKNGKVVQTTEFSANCDLLFDKMCTDFFFAPDQIRGASHIEYDKLGQEVATINPSGHRIVKKYNEQGFVVSQHDTYSGIKESYTYDHRGNLVTRLEELPTGESFMTSYEYNEVGQKVKEKDFLGNTTEYLYSKEQDQVTTLYPITLTTEGLRQAKEEILYDALGRVVREKSPLGYTTEYIRNARGEPILISYGDGSTEQYEYNLRGDVVSHTNRIGVKTIFSYDSRGNVIHTQTYDKNGELISDIIAQYNTLGLVREEDRLKGLTKAYKYNAYGQRVEEKVQEGDQERYIEYAYDEKDRLVRQRKYADKQKSQWVETFWEYDALDRQIREKSQDSNGKTILDQVTTYDKSGEVAKLTIRLGEGQKVSTEKKYLANGYLCEIIDAEGNTTVIKHNFDAINELGQRVLTKTTLFPNGSRLCTQYDALMREAWQEEQNMSGESVSRREFLYDHAGNKSCEKIVHPQSHEVLYEVRWEYDSEGRVTKQVEAFGSSKERVTGFSYNSLGQLIEKKLPGGQVFSYEYNSLGELKRLSSQDGSLSHLYEYDIEGKLIYALDELKNLSISRSYALGRLLEDSLANGLKVKYEYDGLDRVTKVILPERFGSILYVYDGAFLSGVVRVNGDGEEVYRQSIDKYDDLARPIKESLPNGRGEIFSEWNNYGFCQSSKSPYGSFNICKFDPKGHLTAVTEESVLGHKELEYTYDARGQLSSESGPFSIQYNFDYSGNLDALDDFNFDLNSLNQVTESPFASYKYDANGQLQEKQTVTDYWQYAFNSIGNLEEVHKNGDKVSEVTYDPLGRRVWEVTRGETLAYFYIGEEEVGSFSRSLNELIDLKVTLPFQVDHRNCIPIEIRGNLKLALRDFRGNISKLVNGETGELEELYQYSAFGLIFTYDGNGRGKRTPSENSWLYSGSRYSFETELGFYEFRYYDSELARWISPDPIGVLDDINVYRCRKNNHLLYADPFGLSSGPTGLFPLDFLVAVFDAAHHFVTHALPPIFKGAGRILELGAHHLIPDPIGLVKAPLLGLGMTLQGKNMSQIQSRLGSLIHPTVEQISVGSREVPNMRAYYINGINCSRGDFIRNLRGMSLANDNLRITGLRNPDEGIVVNLMRCIFQKIGFHRPFEATLEREVRTILSTDEEVGQYKFLVHSEANFLMGSIVVRLPDQMTQSLEVLGLGSPDICNSSCYKYASSQLDFIGKLSPIAIRSRSATSNLSPVEFTRPISKIPFLDHRIVGGGYQKRIQKFFQEID